MKEKWKVIPGFSGFYKVSDRGNFLSCRGKGGLCNADQKRKEWHPLKVYNTQHHRGHSCQQAALYRDSKRRMLTVHRLVWMTFKGKIPDHLVVDHIDCDPYNNQLKNLRLVTPGENQINREHLKGVHCDPRNKNYKWKARIVYKGVKIFAGSYRTEKEAEKVRRMIETKLYPGISKRTR